MIPPAVILEALRNRPGEYRRACPICEKGKRDDALAIRVDDRGATWYCHRCHYTGSANEGRETRIVAGYSARARRPATELPARWSERAEVIWQRTMPLHGTVGETYLRSRNCIIPPLDSDLRFLPAWDDQPPCLVASITDFVTNEPLSLHFTRLKPDGSGKAGTGRDKVLLRGHRKRGGVIRLWPDDAVTLSLVVAEGIESALSAAHLHTPAWATVDAGNMSDLPVLEGIEFLAVFADHDPTGIRAARSLVTRWRQAGRQAIALMPTVSNADSNDAVRGAV